MKTLRTVVLIGVVLAVFGVIAAKTVLNRRASVYTNTPPQEALAAAKEAGRPAWLFMHSADYPRAAQLDKTFRKLEREYGSKVAFVDQSILSVSPETGRLDRFPAVPTSRFYDKTGKLFETRTGFIPEHEARQILKDLRGNCGENGIEE